MVGGNPSPAATVRITDDFGQEITLNQPAKRIIALYGAYNEILAAIGVEDRLVGRTKTDVLPASIRKKPSIGTHMRPNVEMVMGLKPDLIIQSSGRKESMMVVRQLQREGLKVAVFHPTDFESLFSVIRRLGVLTGKSLQAEELVDSLQLRLRNVAHCLHGIRHRPRVFFEVRYPNLLGAGRGSIVNDIIQKAGGLNCMDSDKKLVRIGMETLIEQHPEVYIIQRGPMNKNPTHPSERPHFRILEPVKTGRIMFVDEQVYSRPGPRSVEAVEALAVFLHPDAFVDNCGNGPISGKK
ncbi:periplasmic binding protein [delta proteobacterium NaphS2]|nr:periplasmic binding protein [delta proteobacterium NaphS2]